MASEVICCFCGDWLLDHDSVQLAVFPTADRDESQTLYSHRKCLAERLTAGIPKHPLLLDSDE